MTVPSGPAAPAGWYPSDTSGIELYWDGAAWTGQARPAGQETVAAAVIEGPPGMHRGTGAYAGLFHDGKRWFNPDGTPVQSWMLPKAAAVQAGAVPAQPSRSTGRTIGGILAFGDWTDGSECLPPPRFRLAGVTRRNTRCRRLLHRTD